MPFLVEVSEDRLICKVSWDSSGGGEKKPASEKEKPGSDKEKPATEKVKPTRDDLVKLINSKGIKLSDPSLIDKAFGTLVKEGKLKDFILSEGKPTIAPRDGILKWSFDPDLEKISAGKVEGGSIDFRERQVFVSVEKDQLLGTWEQPILGRPGLDVFGKPIKPLNPNKNKIAPGKNVKLSQDHTKCYSTIKGHVLVSGFKVSVDKLYQVDGDVDFNVGNIHFPGNVQISGDIRENFIVEAKGDVVIGGVVDSAEVRATGSILVKRGIVRDSRVIAGSDLEAEFIQDSYVECEGKLTVEKSIVKSRVNANDEIKVTNLSGANGIVGGVVNAGYGVSTFCLGSNLGVKTEVGAGKNSKLFLVKKHLESSAYQAKGNIKRFKYFIELMKTRVDEEISEADKKKLEKIEKALAAQKSEFDSLIEKLEDVNAEAAKFLNARIKVFGTAHDGLEINIWGAKLRLEVEVENSVFYLDHEKNEILYKTL